MEGGKNMVYDALKIGDFVTALPWLEKVSQSEHCLPDRSTPLHYASRFGRVDVAQRLIVNCRCSIESKDAQGCTPLHTAAQYGQVEMLKYLLRGLFSPEESVKLTPGAKLYDALGFEDKLWQRDQNGNTPLHTACIHGQLDIVRLLVREIGFNPVDPNHEHLSCLHLAAQHGHLSLVRYLVEEVGIMNRNEWPPYLEKGVNNSLTTSSHYAHEPLAYQAAEGGHLDIIKYLVEEKGVSPHVRTKWRVISAKFTLPSGRYLVHAASRNGHLNVVKYLIEECGCDASCKDNGGFTPLHVACQEGHNDIVSYLITERRCDANSTTIDGKTCMHLAASSGKLDVIRFICVDCGCRSYSGRSIFKHDDTPLHCAAMEGHLEVVKFFIEEMKCDPNLMGEEHLTPLQVSLKNKHLEVSKYLIGSSNCKVNLDASFSISNRPLYLAAQMQSLELIEHFNHCHRLKQSHINAAKGMCSNPNIISLLEKYMDPLFKAATKGNLEDMKYYLRHRRWNPNELDTNSNHLFHVAAQNGHLAVMKYLCTVDECRAFLDRKGRYGKTPLHLACEHGCLDVVKYMVERRCNPLCRDKKGQTPLHKAAASGHAHIVHYFVNTLGIDCNLLVDDYKDTPLHYGAFNGHLDVVREVTKSAFRADVLKPDLSGENSRTPLHYASTNGHLEVVKYLVNAGADPSCVDTYGDTPLHKAADKGHLDVVKFYALTLTCDILVRNKISNIPLHCAAKMNRCEVVNFFLEDCNIDPNILGHRRMTPLHMSLKEKCIEVSHYLISLPQCATSVHLHCRLHNSSLLYLAVQTENLELVKHLCERRRVFIDLNKVNSYLKANDIILQYLEDYVEPLCNAAKRGDLDKVRDYVEMNKWDPNELDRYGYNTLHQAAYAGQLEVVKYLAEGSKCDPNSKSKRGRTPLHRASENGCLDVVKYLVHEIHCDPLSTDEDGDTPLHRAAAKGMLEVVEYFITDLGCNILARNNLRNTPLHCAIESNHLELVKFFIASMNCDPNVRGMGDLPPLHLSLQLLHFDISKYLIEVPLCDVFAKVTYDNAITNSLYLALKSNNLSLIKHLFNTHRLDPFLLPDREKLLKSTESDVFQFLNNYNDLLIDAAANGNLKEVKYYIETRKWDPLQMDRHGQNTLHSAAQCGHLDVVKYLTGLNKDPIHEEVEILCDPLVKNKEGQTAHDIALQSGHEHIVSYFLRTSNKPIFKQDVISPPLSVFVVGNSGSGKSTLVKALSAENSLLGGMIQVKGVTPLTAGIVPTSIHSQVFGKVNVYDFAGHEEYYASHEAILQQTIQPLVLLAVNVSLPEDDIRKQVLYWLSMLSSSMDASKNLHVVIIGSHSDQILFKEKQEKYQLVTHLSSGFSTLKYHGSIQCDCRYSSSDNLNRLRQKLNKICRSIRLFLARESDTSNKLCAALMYHLQHSEMKQATITVNKLYLFLRPSVLPGSKLAPFADQTVLLETCKELSSNGHLLLLPHDTIEQESVLILEKHVILSKVHACLRAKEVITNKIGMLEEQQLQGILSDLLHGTMEPELAIKYLIFTQFCTEITTEQLISVPENFVGVIHYFFPSLVSAQRPADILSLEEEDTYTHFYTWGVKCSNAHEFFTPRFLHTMFVQLIKCERDTIDSRFTVWKNGILLAHSNGTRSIIEVTSQTTRLHLAMQCVKGCESNLVRQRSKLILLIKSLLDKVCLRVKREEFLLLPETDFLLTSSEEISLSDVAKSVVHGHPTVLFDREGLTSKHINVTDLLHFDPFHFLEERMLRKLFNNKQSNKVVPYLTVRKLQKSLKGCDEMAKALEDKVDGCARELTYCELFSELIKFSIFTDENLYTLADIDLLPFETINDPELPTIVLSDPGVLYRINILLIKVVQHWKDFGLGLGLKSPTIDRIQSRYLYHQHVERCFTEVLAAWLNGEDRSPDSPDPNWEEVVAALKFMDMEDFAHQLQQTLTDNYQLQESVNLFKSVDSAEISPSSLGEVLNYVQDLNHKWFHLGLSLGLRYPTLRDVEASPHHHDVKDHMIAVLNKWLNSEGGGDSPSWKILALALDCPLVRENRLALTVQREHLN